MYPIVLAIHNVVRWVALIVGALAVLRAAMGVVNKCPWVGGDRLIGMLYTSFLDVQLLMGLLLYFFLSPLTLSTFQHFGASMGSPYLRFFALVHPLFMVVAVIFGHLGSVRSRKADNDATRFQQALIWYGLSFFLVFLGTPWMRPLLPGF